MAKPVANQGTMENHINYLALISILPERRLWCLREMQKINNMNEKYVSKKTALRIVSSKE